MMRFQEDMQTSQKIIYMRPDLSTRTCVQALFNLGLLRLQVSPSRLGAKRSAFPLKIWAKVTYVPFFDPARKRDIMKTKFIITGLLT